MFRRLKLAFYWRFIGPPWAEIRNWKPELPPARVGLWLVLLAFLIDFIAHPHYWLGRGTYASRGEGILVFFGVIAMLVDLHEMLTLRTVQVPGPYQRKIWFPRREVRTALRSGLAIDLEDDSQLVSPETYTRLLHGELAENG